MPKDKPVSRTDLPGVWKRVVLVDENGEEDRQSEVYWVQTRHFCGDIRLQLRHSTLADLSANGHAPRIDAFAGHLIGSEDAFRWEPLVHSWPINTLPPDEGRLSWIDENFLHEEGIHRLYSERWQRIAVPSEDDFAVELRHPRTTQITYVLRVGPYVFYARGAAAGAAAEDDCEFSLFEICSGGPQLVLSTVDAALATCPVTEDAAPEIYGRLAESKKSREAGSFDSERQPSSSGTNAMTTFESIPVVDVTALGGSDVAEHARAIAALRDSAKNVGFLYVAGHGIAAALSENLLTAAKAFFALPVEEKMKVYIGLSRNHRGYVPEGEEVFAGGTPDRKEAFDLSIDLGADDPDYKSGNPLLGPNQWPASLPGFREAVMAYYDAAFHLGSRLLRGFSEALDLPTDYLDRFITKPPSQLRLIHYPYFADRADRPGIGAHTDYELFTVLFPTAPGLEVMNGEGVWIDVPPIPDALVINIGDMLEVLSNGIFTATSHRVRAVKEERYSFPLFFSCDYSTVVRPLPQFVTAGQPPAYEEVVAGEHLHAQTVLTFKYLRERRDRGELRLPEGSRGLSSFGQEARHTTPTAAS